MKVLFIGDIVGESGQKAIKKFLPTIKQKYKPQLTIANGENISNGKGISEKLYKWLLAQGIDVVTLGNHAWDDQDIYNFIDEAKVLVRPINLPDTTPGVGVRYIRVNEHEIAVINCLGTVFMNPALNPFFELPKVLKEVKKRTRHIIIDFHAETTSEKEAIAYYLDGQVSAVLGTHTHVQTADAQLLPNKTAYISDVGMTGARVSILGCRTEEVIKRFVTQLPTRLEQPNTEDVLLSAVVVSLNQDGLATKIESLYIHNHTFTKLTC